MLGAVEARVAHFCTIKIVKTENYLGKSAVCKIRLSLNRENGHVHILRICTDGSSGDYAVEVFSTLIFTFRAEPPNAKAVNVRTIAYPDVTKCYKKTFLKTVQELLLSHHVVLTLYPVRSRNAISSQHISCDAS